MQFVFFDELSVMTLTKARALNRSDPAQPPIGAIPNFATEKEQKRNFLDFNDVTLVVVDIKSERFVKSTCLQQDLFDMTMVTIMFDTKTSESESFIDRLIEGIINIMMEFHHF